MNTPTRIHTSDRPEGNTSRYGSNQIGHYIERFFREELPASPVIVSETIEVSPGQSFRVHAWGDHLFVDTLKITWQPWAENTKQEKTEGLVTVERISDAYTKEITTERTGYWNRGPTEDITHLDAYLPDDLHRESHHYDEEPWYIPYAYLKFRVTAGDKSVEIEHKFKLPSVGRAKLQGDLEFTISCDFFGQNRTWRETMGQQIRYHHHYTQSNALWRMMQIIGHGDLADPVDVWWDRFLNYIPQTVSKNMGLASTLKRKTIKPNLDKLQAEAPLEHQFFTWLWSHKMVEKTKNNSLLADFLKTVGEDYDKLYEALHTARTVTMLDPNIPMERTNYSSHTTLPHWHGAKRFICLSLPGAKERHESDQAKADFTKRKSFGGQADGLGVTKNSYPLLRLAIEGGHIPIGVFNQPDKQPVNREFSLWEKALKQPGWAEVIYEITENAARRGTYERDITPYLMFLFRLPVYLKRHTKKKWTTKPKFVQSQWELEMDEADESGTTKRRSAFTPVADNDMREVEVPYVAVSVSGVRTQWCYSRHFYIFEEGFTDPESGGVVLRDLEPQLNGRDDYGLCYYTLTGTVTARGYPTFLVIFEKVSSGLRVHFHRVRPQRSKNKIKTPACELIEACYQYMAGNVPAEQVAFQQGDLMFIPHPNDPVKAGAKVGDPQEATTLEFESHKFEVLDQAARVTLYRSEAKTPVNRLGFLCATGGFKLSHPEHDDINEIGEGWWEVRRAKSWEANPQAIWSLTID